MKRNFVIKKVLSLLNNNDAIIFSGSDVCYDGYLLDKDNHFYIPNSFNIAVSFALGIAMTNDKRVFVFVGEGDFLRDLSILPQISASECKNIFVVLLDNGCYNGIDQLPHVFDSVLSKKGFIYNAGCKIKDFTSHFEMKEFKLMKNVFDRLNGSTVILFSIDKYNNKNEKKFDINLIDNKNRFIEFIRNKTIESSLFIPPDAVSVVSGKTSVLNLDNLQVTTDRLEV